MREERSSSPRARARALGAALGLAAALAWAALALPNLTGQGAHYDELFAAAPAFAWLGQPTPMFCLGKLGPLCLLNQPYGVAFKTNLYGAWLRLRGAGFSLAHWRGLGILTIATGLLLLGGLSCPAIGPLGASLLLALTATDLTLLVLGRFDWGPVAISFLFRVAALGLALRADSRPTSLGTAAGVGALAGLAILEKLSAVAALPAYLLLIAREPYGRRRRLAAALAALALVGLPLLLYNALRYHELGFFISLADAPGVQGWPPRGLLEHFAGILALGGGAEAAEFALDLAPSPWRAGAVAVVLGGALLLLLGGGVRTRFRTLGGRLAFGWLLTVIALAALPRATWIHHWLIAAPFAAAALAAAAARPEPPLTPRGRRALQIALLAVLALQVTGLPHVERAFAAGRSSLAFDPSLNRLGELAARRAGSAVFVASDWGVATQIACWTNGRPRTVREFYWNYRGAAALARFLRASGTDTAYLVRLRGAPRVDARTTALIESDLAAVPGWREVAPEARTRHWRAVSVRKFVRGAGRAGPPRGAGQRRPKRRSRSASASSSTTGRPCGQA